MFRCMTITTSYFGFELESVGESRRERIMIIWSIGWDNKHEGNGSSIKEFINQSGPSLAGREECWEPFVSTTSSLVQAPSQCQCTCLGRVRSIGTINKWLVRTSMQPHLWRPTYVYHRQPKCPAMFASPLKAIASPTFPPTSHLNPQLRLEKENRSLLGYQLELSRCNVQTSRDQFLLMISCRSWRYPRNAV